MSSHFTGSWRKDTPHSLNLTRPSSQDYDKYGIHDVVEKQALFKVIKGLNEEDISLTLSPEPSMTSNLSSQANSSPEPLARFAIDPDTEDDLLDLDSDDDDFLQSFSDAFAQSLTPDKLATLNLKTADVDLSDTAISSSSPQQLPPPRITTKQQQQQQVQQLQRTTSTAASVDASHTSTTATATATEADIAALAEPPRIRVIVRKRPLNKKEIERGDSDVLQCDSENATLFVHEPKQKVDLTKYTDSHAFCFDDVFDESVDNDAVYQRAIRPLIATLFRAGKGTCFAYGQTGSGKTYTMGPLPLRAAADIFALISAAPEYSTLSLHVACYEIYGGKVFDLLNNRQRLEVREDGKRRVQVVGLKEVEVKSIDVLMKLCDHSACARSTGQTGANDESSRSHSIMVFSLRAPAPPPASASAKTLVSKAATGGNRRSTMVVMDQVPGQGQGQEPVLRTVGKLSFIDLAGSERGADTYDNDKQTRLEGAEINKSLLALKECIRALDAEARHIPFRGSKLTEVLRDSFVGKHARTVMIANVSPNSSSCEHTLNTLRYADRVKEIKKDQVGPGGGGGMPSTAPVPPSNEVSQEARTVAALLHRMPPPIIPRSLSGGGGSGGGGAAATTTNVLTANGEQQQERKGGGGGVGSAVKTPSMLTASQSPTKKQANNTNSNANETTVVPTTTMTPLNTRTGRTNGTTNATPGHGSAPPPITSPFKKQQQQSQQQQQPRPTRRAAATATSTPAPLPSVLSDASQTSIARSMTEGGEDAMLAPLLAAEEELIAAHRSHIEVTMAAVREEMELLSQLDDASWRGGSVENYIEELGNILVEKAAAVAALQQQVTAFKRQMKAAAAAAAAVSNGG